jgi:hypothetical protein
MSYVFVFETACVKQFICDFERATMKQCEIVILAVTIKGVGPALSLFNKYGDKYLVNDNPPPPQVVLQNFEYARPVHIRNFSKSRKPKRKSIANLSVNVVKYI